MSYTDYSRRPSKAPIKHLTEQMGATGRVVEVGRYEVFVPDNPEIDITFRDPNRNQRQDVESVFPNAAVVDGELRLPVDDVIDQILNRSEPAELATSLWKASPEVAEAFVEAFVTYAYSGEFTHNQRMDFLLKVKQQVHNVEVNSAASIITRGEQNFARDYFIHDAERRIEDYGRMVYAQVQEGVGRCNHRLEMIERELSVKYPNEKYATPRLEEPPAPPQFRSSASDSIARIGGKTWDEAREHWREYFAAKFPAPPEDMVEEILRLISRLVPNEACARQIIALVGTAPNGPYYDELMKIAGMVGEADDPFAARESIDLLLKAGRQLLETGEDDPMYSDEEMRNREVQPTPRPDWAVAAAAQDTMVRVSLAVDPRVIALSDDPEGLMVDQLRVALDHMVAPAPSLDDEIPF